MFIILFVCWKVVLIICLKGFEFFIKLSFSGEKTINAQFFPNFYFLFFKKIFSRKLFCCLASPIFVQYGDYSYYSLLLLLVSLIVLQQMKERKKADDLCYGPILEKLGCFVQSVDWLATKLMLMPSSNQQPSSVTVRTLSL